MPLVNTWFLLVLPSFQFVLYSSLQRLFSVFHSPRQPFLCLTMCLCLFLVLSPGNESSAGFCALSPQEPLCGHCHALRGLSDRGSLLASLLESSHQSAGKWEGELKKPALAFFVPFYKALVPTWQTTFFHKHVPFFQCHMQTSFETASLSAGARPPK